jgi:hypothetical protein
VYLSIFFSSSLFLKRTSYLQETVHRFSRMDGVRFCFFFDGASSALKAPIPTAKRVTQRVQQQHNPEESPSTLLDY